MPAKRPRCRGTTATGRPCRNPSVAGSAHCSVHGGGRRLARRPLRLTPDLEDVLVRAVQTGAHLNVAAASAGISETTFRDWRRQGAEDLEANRSTPFSSLVSALTRAQAESELRAIRVLESSAWSDWRAAHAFLVGRFPDRWAPRRDRAGEPDDDAISRPRKVTPTADTREQVLALLRTATAPPAGADEENPA